MSSNPLWANWIDKHPTGDLAPSREDKKPPALGKTAEFSPEDAQRILSHLPDKLQAFRPAVKGYIRLPHNPERDTDTLKDRPWRIILAGRDPRHDLPPLELCGDVFVGRVADGIRPDLELTPYGAVEMGVSRQHALLRPTPSKLLIHDLGSANGTYLNAKKLTANAATEVCDGDILTFGKLRFKVSIIERP